MGISGLDSAAAPCPNRVNFEAPRVQPLSHEVLIVESLNEVHGRLASIEKATTVERGLDS